MKDNIEKYDKIRSFLRLIYVHGCYSREDIEGRVISSQSKYDEVLSRIGKLYSINTDENKKILHHERYGKYIIHQLKYTPFVTVNNFLVESYRLKAFTEKDVMLYFHIQQILMHNDEELNCNSIHNSLADLPIAEISPKTLKRKLDFMTTHGILRLNKRASGNFYSIADDPFENLTNSELLELYVIVDFFTNTTYPRVLGNFLKSVLYNYLMQERKLNPGPDPFLFHHNSLHAVLDEEVVTYILQALEHQHIVRFDYTTHEQPMKDTTVIPLKLIMDSSKGRWYLLARGLKSGLFVYRLSRIENLSILKSEVTFPDRSEYENCLSKSWGVSEPGSDPKSVVIRFKDDPGQSFVLRRVEREGKWGQVDDDDLRETGFFYYRIDVTDLTGITPWIRSFGHRAEVLEPATLRNKLRDDWFDLLIMYDQKCRISEKTGDAALCNGSVGRNQPKSIVKCIKSSTHLDSICGVKVQSKIELFTEVNSRSFVALKELIERMGKQELSTNDINAILLELGMISNKLPEAKSKKTNTEIKLTEFQKSLFNEHKDSKRNYHLLVKNSKDTFILNASHALPHRPLSSELKWLNYILRDPKVLLFIEPDTLIKLKKSIGQDKVHWHKYVDIRREGISSHENMDTESLRMNLQIILKAIRENKGIRYNAITSQGKIYKNELSFPYKIEYSSKHDRFYVLMLSINGNMPVKAKIKNLSEIRFEDYVSAHPQSLASILETKKHDNDIILEVIDQSDALERALLTFSEYEKSAYYDRKRQRYTITISYYTFDESELRSRILSLGKWVRIISCSPAFKEDIMFRINTAAGLYGG